MRKYIRHPSNIPIEYKQENIVFNKRETIHNISVGGLSFESNMNLKKNTIIDLHIPNMKPPFFVKGIVVRCQKNENSYDIGVKFLDKHSAYRVRMIEQICYIEEYRKKINELKRRKITSEEAAQEWINKYAKDFPFL